ncbi:unnamed protein product [Musa hybrid cultivar]
MNTLLTSRERERERSATRKRVLVPLGEEDPHPSHLLLFNLMFPETSPDLPSVRPTGHAGFLLPSFSNFAVLICRPRWLLGPAQLAGQSNCHLGEERIGWWDS